MLESYITPLLTSFLNKYIKNLKPSDLQLSFWGGDAILRNLELRLDAIEELLSSMAPFEMKSGNVKQLTVHIPWTSIGSEPIEVTFESVECTIKLKELSLSSKSKASEVRQPAKETQPSIDQPQAPGYLQGLISRISNNVIIHVNNLLVKVIEEQCDLLMSVSVKQLNCCTANDSWEKEFVFTDSLQGDYHLHNLCSISDMTVCLDLIGSSGQVEVFESPFVPKCSLVCRLARYFKRGVFVETKLDVLCEGELHFSVSEQQFSLFLHLLDWLMAMYYSFKKLKGRDDNESSDKELPVEQTKHSPSRSPKLGGHTDVPGTTKGPADLETQQNWGSWMMSFITGEDEDGTTGDTIGQQASPPPTLSLSVHVSSISVAFCATGCRQQPIFPSTFNKHKHTSQVVLARFTGCMARVVRAPSSAFLACSVGVMSVSAWVCGSCLCDEQTIPDRRRGLSPVDRMEQVYVYSLGTVLDESQTKKHLLAESLFAEVSEDPEYTEYLRQREAYDAVWFSYHDLDVMEGREVEECNEKLVIGKTLLFLSPDVLHRLMHFIQSFLDTLEAHPLLSNGITVIGDPRSKTELQFHVSPFKILLTTKVHFISHKKQLLSPVSSSPTSTPAILGSCDGIQGKLIMPTYSRNAVAEFSQCRLLEISLAGLSVNTVTLLSPGLDAFQSLFPESPLSALPSISFSFYQQMFEEKSADNSYWQINSPVSTIQVSSHQLEPLLEVVQSWCNKQRLPCPPSQQLAEGDSTLVLNLSNLSGEWSQNESDTSYSVALGCVSISLAYPNTTSRPVSILYSPSNTQNWSTIEAWSTNNYSSSSPFSANKAAELYVCVPTETRKGDLPQFKLTIAGASIHISSAALRYVETVHFLSALNVFSGDFYEAEKGDYEALETHSEVEGSVAWLQWLKSCNMEVNISPIVVAVSTDAPNLHVVGNSTSKPSEPVDDVLYNLSSSLDIAVLTLPSLVVSSSIAGLHPALTPLGAPSNPQSWHCLLARGAAFTRLSGTAKHLLHPVSLEVSIATVKPATPTQAYGLGVHVDVKDVHMSVSEAQVVLTSRLFSAIKNTITAAIPSSSPPAAVTVTTPIAPPKESSSGYAPSLTPSPLLSHLSLSLPLPPSESSVSTHSSYAVHHSLWMQVTLSRLTIELNSNDGVTDSDCYVLEAEDTSVSVDIQEKSSSYHFKVFSLEVTSGQMSSFAAGMQAPFTKLFSSSSSVLRESASEAMEEISPLSSTLSAHTPPLSNFFTIDVVTHQSAHKPTQVCMRVQSFEAVLWLGFVKHVLQIFAAFEKGVSESTVEERNGSSKEDTKRQLTVEFWPHIDVYLKCFHILIPTSSLSSTVIVDCGEVAVTSDLSFPVSRLTLDASSLRNLELLSGDKRQPPLPGYQLSARSVSAKTISAGINTDNRFEVAILSSPTDIRAVYSPPLSCPPSLPHPLGRQTKSTVGSGLAAGVLLELHIDTDLTINVTPKEVKVFLELFDDIHKATTPTTSDDHTNVPSISDTIPVQLLITGRVVQVLLPSGEKLSDGSGERLLIETSCFNPVLMVNIGKGVSVEFSLFNISVAITSDCSDKEDLIADSTTDVSYTPVVETRPGTSDSHANNSSLPPNLLIARVEIKDNSSAISIEVGRPLKISLSPSIVQQLLGMSTTFLQFLKPEGQTSSNGNHSTNPFSVFQFLSKLSTSQVVVEILDQQENEGVGKFILCWEELSTLPSVESQRITEEEVSTSIVVTGVHLVCVPGGVVDGCGPVFMVAPTNVECNISSHSPQSIYDSIRTDVLLSCELLHGEINRLVLFQANRILQQYFTTVLGNGKEINPPGTGMGADLIESCTSCSNKESVHSEDDLKRGEFKFITENKGRVTPCPGEVIIVEEKEEEPAAIVWQYREPRVVSKVLSSPVPLVLPESQCGNLKVICTLSQWADEKSEFVATATFSISETIPEVVQVKFHSPARVWGIMVTALEWVEGEYVIKRVELPSANHPISSIFSPVGLVACTRVDSSIAPASMPTLSLSASVKEASLLLTHLPSDITQKENDYLAFQGFTVCDDVSLHKLELAKLVLTNLSGKFAIQAGDKTTAEVGCLATVKYTDFQDLTWVTASSLTEFTVSYQERMKEQSPNILREIVINLDVGSLAVRMSPSLVHSVTMMSYLCRYDDNSRQTIVCSHFIICNNTVENLQLRQATTDEHIQLRRRCCIGYMWRNHRTVTKFLQVQLEAHQCSKWSKPFSINCEDGQQLISLGGQPFLYAVIKSIGGFQKMVTLVGGLKFSSLLPFPLSLRLVSQPAVLDSESHQSLEYHLPAYGDGELPSLAIAEATSVQACQTGQTRWSLVLPIGSHRKGWSRPQLMTEVPSQDGMCQCWVKSVSSETVGENLSVEVTFAPLLTVTNALPFDIHLTILPANDDGSAPLSLEGSALPWCTVPGRGLTTAPCGLRCDQSNYIYLKHGDSHEVSSPLAFSLADASQLPVIFEDCTCDWPYSDCAHNWPDGHKPKCTEFVLSCAGRKFHLVASFRSIGAVNLLLAPQCLIVNQLELPLFLKLTKEREKSCLSVEKSSVFPFALEEVQLGVGTEETDLWSDPLMLVDTVGCTKLTLNGSPEHKVTCSLMMRQSTHCGCVVFTVMPTHLLVNQTGMMLKANCLLSHNCLPTNRSCVTDIASNVHTALLFWQASEQAAYTLILTADTSLSAVSIPLPLNFVRRSFSLPCATKDGTIALPCLLSTHDQNNTTYVVVSKDLFPRLLISNLSSKPLEVTEARTTDLYCHPQLLGVGKVVAYEPPSLAKQYPLINSKEREENEQGNLGFKTVNQVLLKLRVCDAEIEEEKKEWSKSFHLLSDSEQVVRISNYESLFVTVSSKEATILVSLLPMTGEHYADTVSHRPAVVKPLKFTSHIKELVACLDCEQVDSAVNQAAARIITESIDLFFSKNSEESTGRIAISSIQIDNVTGDSTGYKVVFTPRKEHIPSHHLVKTDMPPFLLITFQKAISPSSLFHKIHISAQPATIQLDSSFLQSMKNVFATFKPPELLKSKVNRRDEIPAYILAEASQDEMPLVISSLVVEQLSVYVSARVTMKVALSCDNTLLQFACYELTNVYSNQIELSNCIAAHYTTQLIWQIWWGLGSLDLIGSPTVLFHSIRSGVSDFFSLPYEGLTMGPGFFIVGLGQGVASLVGSLSGGMLRSLTNFSSGVAHNMEKLSLDPEHASYQEEYRRKEVPARLSSGLASGASSFGLSVVSALAGVVDQPMRSVQAAGEAEMGLGGYASSMIKGVGKGLLGVVTKPVGGAFQLVSQTSQGLMNSVGLLHTPQQKITSSDDFCALMKRTTLHPTNTKCIRLLFMDGNIIFCTCGTLYTGFKSSGNPCYILLTTCHLLIVPADKDQLLHRFSVHKHTITVSPSCIPGEASLTISQIEVQQYPSPCPSTKFHTPEQEDDLHKSTTSNQEKFPMISLLPHRARILCHFFKIALRQKSDTYFCSF